MTSTITDPPAPVCTNCNTMTKAFTATTCRRSRATVFRCAACRRQGQLHLDPADDDDVHRLLKKRLRKELAKTINTTPESAA